MYNLYVIRVQCQHYTKIIMNNFDFNKYNEMHGSIIWLIGHIRSINVLKGVVRCLCVKEMLGVAKS